MKTIKNMMSVVLTIVLVICFLWNNQLPINATMDDEYLSHYVYETYDQYYGYYYIPHTYQGITQDMFIEGLLRKYDNGILYGFGCTYADDYDYYNDIRTLIRAWGGTVCYQYDVPEEQIIVEWYHDLAFPPYDVEYPIGSNGEKHYVYIQESSHLGNDMFKYEFEFYLNDRELDFGVINLGHSSMGSGVSMQVKDNTTGINRGNS